MKWIVATILLALGLAAASMPAPAAPAEVRIALVIGNAAYTDITPLRNPVNDARLMRDTLHDQLGFEVIYVENADKARMDRAISDFGAKLAAAGTRGVAVFYYAGHGVQSGGQNFLLPVGVSVEREADLRLAGIRAEDVLSYMESAQSAVKIAIIDACRDNPFAVRFRIANAPRGLADISLGNSEFTIAYAATAGNTADDGAGVNSPYAASLARRLVTPDAEIFDVLRMVRIDVSNVTKGKQLPEARTTLRREVYLKPTGARGTTQVALLTTVAPAAATAPSGLTTPPKAPVPAPPQALPSVAAAPKSAMVLASNGFEITGRWCQASRALGPAVAMNITTSAILYEMAEGQSPRFGVRSIQPNATGNIEIRWLNKQVPMVFEFGDFSGDGQRMTQIRGRNEMDSDWKNYDRQMRRC